MVLHHVIGVVFKLLIHMVERLIVFKNEFGDFDQGLLRFKELIEFLVRNLILFCNLVFPFKVYFGFYSRNLIHKLDNVTIRTLTFGCYRWGHSILNTGVLRHKREVGGHINYTTLASMHGTFLNLSPRGQLQMIRNVCNIGVIFIPFDNLLRGSYSVIVSVKRYLHMIHFRCYILEEV